MCDGRTLTPNPSPDGRGELRGASRENGTDGFLDCKGWQAMLDRECSECIPVAQASIGVLRRTDFAARRGMLLLWQGGADGARASLHEYGGATGADVAMLLVADGEAVRALRDRGLVSIPALVRQGKLHPYMLKTLDELEAVGLADFVEDLGLVFPKH